MQIPKLGKFNVIIGENGVGKTIFVNSLNWRIYHPFNANSIIVNDFFDTVTDDYTIANMNECLEILELEEFNVNEWFKLNTGHSCILFYLCLMMDKKSPSNFIIENVDYSINPKLCWWLAKKFSDLTKSFNKQIVVTVSNPGFLNGIDLNDDDNRLFVLDRSVDDETFMKRIHPMEPLDDDLPIPLAEAWLRGYIGGLPKTF